MAMAPLSIAFGMVVLCIGCHGTRPGQRLAAWSSGKAAWKSARKELGDQELWDKPNSCDPRVLRSSAPLTVLFGLSTIWDRMQHRREADGVADKPLEVHVLGAAYPFEGRSDWSLLAAQRPPEVPKVRVSLVLGTPFQSDNVPPLHNQPNSFLGLRNDTAAGRWSDKRSEIICEGGGQWGTESLDKNWSKADLCRDHGNGLEVVCIEKYYQDVRDQLPKPDIAVMFSPGFPQLARRTWDDVLVRLLNNKVPALISDVTVMPSWGYKLSVPAFGKQPIIPGARWNPKESKNIGEDWQTWLAMKKYGAYRAKARRGPFPILHKEDGQILAKNAVVQIYHGYKPSRKPVQLPSADDIAKYHQLFQTANWESLGNDRCPVSELKKALAFPTSKPFDDAVREMYIGDYQQTAKRHNAHSPFKEKELAILSKYGLLQGKADNVAKRKIKRWRLKAWLFIFKNLGCENY